MLSKEQENIKKSLLDEMDQRFGYQNVRIETETATLKKTYVEICEDVKRKGDSLSGDFKEKFGAIKLNVSTYFAKIDAKTNKNDEKLDKLNRATSEFMTNFINPRKEIDGQLFTINVRIKE